MRFFLHFNAHNGHSLFAFLFLTIKENGVCDWMTHKSKSSTRKRHTYIQNTSVRCTPFSIAKFLNIFVNNLYASKTFLICYYLFQQCLIHHGKSGEIKEVVTASNLLTLNKYKWEIFHPCCKKIFHVHEVFHYFDFALRQHKKIIFMKKQE